MRKTAFSLMICVALPAAAANLLDRSPSVWHTWAPRPNIAPASSIAGSGETAALVMKADSFARYGVWYTVVKGIQPGHYYHFSVARRTEAMDHPEMSTAAMLSWCRDDCTADAIERDYISEGPGGGEWRRHARTLRAPQGAIAVKVELMLRWTAAGSVTWKEASLTEADPPRPRVVRLATTHLRPNVPSTIARNLEIMAAALDRAGAEKIDLVCLSENVAGRGVNLPVPERAQAVSRQATEVLSAKAKQHHMYILTAFEEFDSGNVYNTAVLFDRQGKVAARYRKVHLPLAEAEMGYTPGSSYPVVDTDFGRVGILICWDNWFPEPARIERLKGAEILLWPLAGDSAQHADAITRARAMENGLYIISSSTVGESPSWIVDPSGEVLAEATGEAGYAKTEIDLNREFRSPWLSVGPGLGEGRSLYVEERRPDTYAPIVNRD